MNKLQSFVKGKCGGLTLQHILKQLRNIRLSVGSEAVLCISDDESSQLFWWDLNKNWILQEDKTQLAIAKLLGYKE